MAVAPAARRRGVGRALVVALVERARGEGASHLWLNSRDSAYPFYEALGFMASGDEFDSAVTGIPHRYMELEI